MPSPRCCYQGVGWGLAAAAQNAEPAARAVVRLTGRSRGPTFSRSRSLRSPRFRCSTVRYLLDVTSVRRVLLMSETGEIDLVVVTLTFETADRATLEALLRDVCRPGSGPARLPQHRPARLRRHRRAGTWSSRSGSRRRRSAPTSIRPRWSPCRRLPGRAVPPRRDRPVRPHLRPRPDVNGQNRR